MFWLRTAESSLPPVPPMPTAAMLTVSLGACMPRPSTWRGTIVSPAPVLATVVMNFRRDMPSVMLPPFAHYIAKAHCTMARLGQVPGLAGFAVLGSSCPGRHVHLYKNLLLASCVLVGGVWSCARHADEPDLKVFSPGRRLFGRLPCSDLLRWLPRSDTCSDLQTIPARRLTRLPSVRSGS